MISLSIAEVKAEIFGPVLQVVHWGTGDIGTGEHGVGSHKMDFWVAEASDGAVNLMRTTLLPLNPKYILMPGTIF